MTVTHHDGQVRTTWWSDADLDTEERQRPGEPTEDFVRRVLTEFAGRWNPVQGHERARDVRLLDEVHLGERAAERTRAHDDFGIFATLRGLLRLRDIERSASRRRPQPAPEPEDIEVDPDRVSERLRVLTDLDIEESALATDWSMPEIENRWDRVVIGGREHMAVYGDLVAQMTPLDHGALLTEAQIEALDRRFGECVDVFDEEHRRWFQRGIVTEGEFADRLCRFAWDDGYFERKRVPWFRRVGRVHTGGFVTWPNGDRFAACVVKRLVPNTDGKFNTSYVVFWREDAGQVVITTSWGRKRTVRVWIYHNRIEFGDRTSAVGFANRLTTVARSEAALERDAFHGLPGGGGIEPEWWQNESPWDPMILSDSVGGSDDPVSDGVGEA